MAERFDPYRKWLGIPADEQPPHHYRLLGLALFENDPDVIQEAADRQMAHVQTHKTGKYSDLSQKLLNQLASAKLCLLKKEKKAAYDQQLKAKIAAAKKARQQAIPEAVALTPAAPIPVNKKVPPRADALRRTEGAPLIQVDEPSTSPASRVRARQRGLQTWHLVAGVGFVAAALVVGFVMMGGDNATPVALQPENPETETPATPITPTPEPVTPEPVTPEPVTPSTPEPPKVEPVRPTPPPPVEPPKVDPPKVRPVEPPKVEPKPEPKPEPEPERADDAIILKSRSFGGRFDLSDLVAQAEAAEAAEVGQPATEQYVEIREAAKKLAVPEQAKVDENLELIRDVFKKEFEAAKTPLEKSNLAKFLLKQAAETEGDGSSRYALLTEARDVAMQAGSATGAMKMVDSMSNLFEIDPLTMKVRTLTQGAEVAKTSAQHRSVAANSLALVETAVLDGKYALARQLVELGLGAARKARDGNLVKLASSLNDELGTLQKQFEAANAALETLKNNPDDAAANLAVGRYQCLVTGDWEGGLPQLAKGSDAKLKAAAELDLTNPAEAVEQAKVGDAWWDLAEAADEVSKTALYDRSGHWYRLAVDNVGGLTKAKIDSRLKKLAESAAAGGSVDEPAIDNDNPLNQKAVGRYQVVASNRRSKDRETSIWELKANHQALKDGQVVARWEATEGSRVKITFLDDVQGTVYVKFNRYVPAGGQHTLASGNESWKWDITALKVVAIWEHSARRTERLTFYSNGKINDPTGNDTWVLRGNELSLNFADNPNDSVTVRLAPGGKTYSGRIGGRFGFGFYPVEGKLLQGPESP